MDPRAVTELSGINYFSFFSFVCGKKFLFLGEKHNKIRQDNSVEDWLEQLMLEAPDCVDFFIEEHYIIKDNPVSITSRDLLAEKFKSSIRREGKIYSSDKFRLHYVDVRFFSVLDLTIAYPIAVLAEYADLRHIILRFPISRKNVEEILTFLVYGWERIYSQEENAYWEFLSSLYKRLFNKSFYSSRLYTPEYMNIFQDIIRKEIKKLSDRQKFLDLFFQLKLKTLLGDSLQFLKELTNIPMDLYTLIRMFVVFDESKMERSPIGCRETMTPVNIIFEGGTHHCKFYTQFIDTYCEVEPDILIESKENSIKLEETFDFFD